MTTSTMARRFVGPSLPRLLDTEGLDPAVRRLRDAIDENFKWLLQNQGVALDQITVIENNPKTPTHHAATHEHGGTDPVGTVESEPFGIPFAQDDGTLEDGWISLSSVLQYEADFEIHWSQVSGTPTTRDGYGITDVYTETEVDSIASALSGDITTVSLALAAHEADHANPHAVTATQVGAYTIAATDTLLGAKVNVALDNFVGLTAGAVLRATSATAAAFGAVDLASTAAVTGLLPWANVDKTYSSLADLTTRSAGDLSSGVLVDARVQQSNVTQHQAALAIAYSQLTGIVPTWNQNTTGSAAKLTTARAIGGVNFDGTADITVATATGGFTVSGGALALGANNLTMTGSLGATGARLTKGWFTDLQVTNAITGSLTGNAATATALQTARAINGVNFDGTGAITVTAAADTLTGTTLNASVVTSSLTAIGTLASGAVPASLVTAGSFGAGAYTVTGQFNVTGAAGANRIIQIQTGGVGRWNIRVNNTAEGGSNAGSLFRIDALDDTGATIDSPLQIDRLLGGTITLARPVTVGSNNALTVTGDIYTNQIGQPNGTDSSAVTLLGGGVGGTSRDHGALVRLYGNTNAGAGAIDFACGDVAGGNFTLETGTNIERVKIVRAGSLQFKRGPTVFSNSAGADDNSGIRIDAQTGTTHFNWQIGAQIVGTSLTIAPSSAAGGTTFSTVMMTMHGTTFLTTFGAGDVTVTGGKFDANQTVVGTYTGFRLRNVDTGTSSLATFAFTNNAGTSNIYLLGSGYTTSGIYKQNAMTFDVSHAGGIILAARNTTGIIDFYTGATPTRRGGFSAAGVFDVAGDITATGLVKSSSATAGIGYAAGAGGTVTQLTSATTGVQLDKICGKITLFSVARGAGVENTFTVTCSAVAAGDVVIANHVSGGTAGAYDIGVSSVGAGSFQLTISNWSAGSLTEAPVIGYAIIKGVTA